MAENQTKAMAFQWIVPTAVLMVVLVIMMYDFSNKSKEGANDTVSKNMVVIAEACADNFTEDLTLLEKVGKPVADLLGDCTDETEVQKLLKVAKDHSAAYKVYTCDSSGEGISNDGTEISVAGTEYFEKMTSTGRVQYFFVEQNTMPDEAEDTIVVSVPVEYRSGRGYLMLFYPVAKFASTVKGVDFAAWTYEALIDAKGNILIADGADNGLTVGENIFSELSEDSPEVVRKMKSRIVGRIGGLSSLETNQTASAFVYVPISINEWTLVSTVNQSYIDKQVAQQWKSTKTMLYQLVIVIVVFSGVIVVINVLSKIKSNEKKRQLEVKADTDLLTGLNNKLATERKIQEFIEKNPDTQSMMFMLDIDNFKKINDTMGHAFGDEVIRSLGQQISAIFRTSDIIGRAGGDEFIIFLKNVSDAAAVRKEAKKVEDFFKDFKAGEYVKYSATASIGVAIYPQEGADFESIYKAADQALYKAKKRGKNQLAFYKDEWAETKS